MFRGRARQRTGAPGSRRSWLRPVLVILTFILIAAFVLHNNSSPKKTGSAVDADNLSQKGGQKDKELEAVPNKAGGDVDGSQQEFSPKESKVSEADLSKDTNDVAERPKDKMEEVDDDVTGKTNDKKGEPAGDSEENEALNADSKPWPAKLAGEEGDELPAKKDGDLPASSSEKNIEQEKVSAEENDDKDELGLNHQASRTSQQASRDKHGELGSEKEEKTAGSENDEDAEEREDQEPRSQTEDEDLSGNRVLAKDEGKEVVVDNDSQAEDEEAPPKTKSFAQSKSIDTENSDGEDVSTAQGKRKGRNRAGFDPDEDLEEPAEDVKLGRGNSRTREAGSSTKADHPIERVVEGRRGVVPDINANRNVEVSEDKAKFELEGVKTKSAEGEAAEQVVKEDLQDLKCKLSPNSVCSNAPWIWMKQKREVSSIARNASIDSLPTEQKWIVISAPNRDVRVNMSQWDAWQKVLVVSEIDQKGHISCGDSCIVLHKHHPDIQSFKITGMVDWNHYARKMVGFLYAIERGAKIIFQSDVAALVGSPGKKDPNPFPLTWIEGMHTHGTTSTTEQYHVINTMRYFGHKKLWPRGLPPGDIESIREGNTLPPHYREESKFTTFMPMQQGIPDWGPDLDPSCTQKLGRRKVYFQRCHLPLAPSEWTFVPANHKFTVFYQPAFHLMFLPGKLSQAIADVSAGYWAQRLLWDLGAFLGVVHTDASVPPSWSPSDSDAFTAEDNKNTGQLVKFLLGQANWQWLCKSKNAMDCAFDLGLTLTEEGYWDQSDVRLLHAWLEDLHLVGNKAPEVVELSAEGRVFKDNRLAAPRQIRAAKLPCGHYSQHWAVLRERMNRAAARGAPLCYPGNEAPAGLKLLESRKLGLRYHERGRPRWPSFLVEHPPRVVYLVQAPILADEELWDDLLAPLCHNQSEVLLLTTGAGQNAQEAVQAQGVGWARARNLLFSTALQLERMRGWRWSYYIFLDDDVRSDGQWLDFERLMHSQHPALLQPRHTRHCSQLRPHGRHEAKAIYDIDPAVSAIHHEAAKQLLPYSTRFDHSDWFHAQTLVSHKCALLYEGHCGVYDGLSTCNRRRDLPSSRISGQVLSDLETEFIRAAKDINETATLCFRALDEVVHEGGLSNRNVELAVKSRAYDTIDYSNAPRCHPKLIEK